MQFATIVTIIRASNAFPSSKRASSSPGETKTIIEDPRQKDSTLYPQYISMIWKRTIGKSQHGTTHSPAHTTNYTGRNNRANTKRSKDSLEPDTSEFSLTSVAEPALSSKRRTRSTTM